MMAARFGNLTPMDLESHRRWYDYSQARDGMLAATHKPFAPWFIVDVDDKRRSRLNCIAHLLSLISYKSVRKNESSHRSARNRMVTKSRQGATTTFPKRSSAKRRTAGRQTPVRGPQLQRGEVPQNSVDFSAAWSTSRSIWRSHVAGSNSANHCRNSASSSAEETGHSLLEGFEFTHRRKNTTFSFRRVMPLP